MEGIVLDLGNSEIIRKSGWKYPTVFSWTVDINNPKQPKLMVTSESNEDDILAPAPTAIELMNELPTKYNDLHLRINAWDKDGQREYGVSYCDEDGSADFVAEHETLEGALSSAWAWINGDTPPSIED